MAVSGAYLPRASDCPDGESDSVAAETDTLGPTYQDCRERGLLSLGVVPDQPVTVVQAEWHGTQALTLTCRDEGGRVDHQLPYRANEAALQIQEPGRAWSFDGDGELSEVFRPAASACSCEGRVDASPRV